MDQNAARAAHTSRSARRRARGGVARTHAGGARNGLLPDDAAQVPHTCRDGYYEWYVVMVSSCVCILRGLIETVCHCDWPHRDGMSL
jgi:hypothetical protein